MQKHSRTLQQTHQVQVTWKITMVCFFFLQLWFCILRSWRRKSRLRTERKRDLLDDSDFNCFVQRQGSVPGLHCKSGVSTSQLWPPWMKLPPGVRTREFNSKLFEWIPGVKVSQQSMGVHAQNWCCFWGEPAQRQFDSVSFLAPHNKASLSRFRDKPDSSCRVKGAPACKGMQPHPGWSTCNTHPVGGWSANKYLYLLTSERACLGTLDWKNYYPLSLKNG